jgi:predicted nucleic acid-binding protein
MKRYVLDAWALIALLQEEQPAAQRVYSLLEQTEENDPSVQLFLSIINLGEVYYIIGRRQGEREAEETINIVHQLSLTILPATEEHVVSAAKIKLYHRLSYADAFAVAAAQELDARLMTGDPELLRLQGIINTEDLRPE